MSAPKYHDRIVEYEGKEWTYQEIADKLDVCIESVGKRVKAGWTPHEIIHVAKRGAPQRIRLADRLEKKKKEQAQIEQLLNDFGIIPNTIYALTLRWVNSESM